MENLKTATISANFGNLLKHDGPAGLVTFLVALPLCLGIALGSGTSLFSGVVAGIIGGLIVSLLSGSQVSVSGPAAGLAVIVFMAIQEIGSYKGFLVAVVLSGLLQLIFGTLRLGAIVDYVPNSVIKGMLAGIGLMIVLKQIPHALGRDEDYMGDFRFLEIGGNNTISHIAAAVASAALGAVLIAVASLALLILWDYLAKKARLFQLLPGPLAVVALGIVLNQLFGKFMPSLQLVSAEHVVDLPVPGTTAEFFRQFTLPDFSAIGNKTVWIAGVTIAVVGSLETLLSLEASDRLDPYKRISSSSKELRAQGIGNTIAGLIGGLPITSVVVRTAASVNAGARTWMSSFVHGLLLLACVILIPGVLRLTPLASLAIILIVVGYKLTKPSLYREVFSQGWDQFLPFIVTVLGVVFLDLLKGVLLGMALGFFFVIRKDQHEAITVVNNGLNYLFQFTKDATFVNKNEFRRKLRELPNDSHLLVDGKRALFIDHDIQEILEDFRKLAPYKNIEIELKQWESYKT
jgi:MFS superfamily sulfate permease-like transporter